MAVFQLNNTAALKPNFGAAVTLPLHTNRA
jgi:hypothetical protein